MAQVHHCTLRYIELHAQSSGPLTQLVQGRLYRFSVLDGAYQRTYFHVIGKLVNSVHLLYHLVNIIDEYNKN